jgi:predicted AAA+ superfamily ATPase
MTKIKDILIESNPWWKTTFTPEYKERDIYQHISKFFPLPQIIALTGLRRVGKTTLLYKIIQHYINKGFNTNNILYFSFDEFRDTQIRDILNEYEQLMEKTLENASYLFLFDEIQNVENWEEQLKRLYDTHGKHIKIIISGSESLFLKKRSKETLAGRIFEFQITPLSFKEFLRFKDIHVQPKQLYEKELSTQFKKYIQTQGFPELVNINDKEIIKKYLKESIVEKVIYRDIPRLFKIRNISLLESLLTIIMEEPGQLVELATLAQDLHISRQTLSTYLRYLEESFLIRKLYNYSRSRRKVERKLKKYYPAILSVDLLFKEDAMSQSKVFEAILVNQLNAEYFWRDPYKNEVDIIRINKTIDPIEIKYGKIETKSLLNFMKKFHVDTGYIISSNQKETLEIDNKHISVTPAYQFLLEEENVGHS